MNVAVKKAIIVMKMPSVQTQMVALHVNVKMDIQEMEQHVMVSGNTMQYCQIPGMKFSLFTIVNSQLKCTIVFIDINECVMEDIQCDSDTVCANENGNYSCEGN